MRGIMALHRNSAAVTIFECFQTQKQKLVWKIALFIFQQVQPLLTCLRKVIDLFCFRFLCKEYISNCRKSRQKSLRELYNIYDVSFRFCEWEVIVQGDEGPVCGVAQVVDCHGVTVGHQEREEEEVEQEVEGDGEKTLKERCACPWMG